ncbi:MAG: 4-aminobutyrate--2-oxoglutarate transaminase [Armatimonadota bacterium]|nr:4-aminobutyrate--2-oxoglutarate transaminase [Armatimonadota bacterium]
MNQTRVLTQLPGPRSQEILRRHGQVVARALSVHLPAVIDRGEGALLFDVDGNRFIDLAGGIGCLAVGHAHPRVVRAIQQQAARFTHTDYTVVPYEGYVELAERLARSAPGDSAKKVALFNSGAEAVENAVKIARAATGRPAVVAFEGAFHGRTYMAMSLTSRVDPYKRDFGPFVPEVYRAPFPYVYRNPYPTPEATADDCIRQLERMFALHVQPDRVAAVVVEPVQGEGGFVVPPPDFLPRLRELCDRHGILLIADEVQTGFGRTGRMWAVEHFGVEPDLITAAKAIASGMPLSAVIGRAEIMDAVPDSGIGGTYVGNPVACAAALAVLDVIEQEGLIERAVHIGEQLTERFRAIQRECNIVGDVRGLGSMVAMEFVLDRDTRTPAPAHAQSVIRRAMHDGVLLLKAGIYGNVIRILAPLVITDNQLHEALDVIHRAVAETQRRPLMEVPQTKGTGV